MRRPLRWTRLLRPNVSFVSHLNFSNCIIIYSLYPIETEESTEPHSLYYIFAQKHQKKVYFLRKSRNPCITLSRRVTIAYLILPTYINPHPHNSTNTIRRQHIPNTSVSSTSTSELISLTGQVAFCLQHSRDICSTLFPSFLYIVNSIFIV